MAAALTIFWELCTDSCNARGGYIPCPCLNDWQYKYLLEISKVLRWDDFAFGWIEMGTVSTVWRSRVWGRVDSRIYALRHVPGTQRRTRSDSSDGRVLPWRADPAMAADRERSAGEEHSGGDGTAFECRDVARSAGIR